MTDSTKTKPVTKLLFVGFLLFLFAYTPGFLAPFYLDDFTSIIENPLVRDNTAISDIFNSYRERTLGYITFWLNYHYIGQSPEAFRLFNYMIHVGVSVSVYLLVSHFQGGKTENKDFEITAFIVSLIYLIHPLNTQAVVYVVQRLTSLGALFVVFSCWFFYLARMNNRKSFIFVAIVLFGMASFTKQNTVITPLLWYLIERLVVRTNRSIYRDLVILLTCGVILTPIIWSHWPTIDRLTRETTDISRLDYFLTQGTVIWIYIANFFFPLNLRLEYSIESDTFSLFTNIFSWLAHFGLWFVAILIRNRWPLVTLGIAWYYVSHIIESTFIPITDLAFEHRTYLPNVGLILSLAPLLFFSLKKNKLPTRFTVAIVLVLLSCITAYRTYEWSKPYLFYQNEVAHNPENQRVLHELGRVALDSGNYDEGIKIYEKIISKKDTKLTGPLLINLVVAYGKVENWDKAEYYEKIAFRNISRFQPNYRARLYLNQGIRLKETGKCREAYKSFESVQLLFKGEYSSLLFRTQCDISTGNYNRAKRTVKALYRVAPNDKRLELIVEDLREANTN